MMGGPVSGYYTNVYANPYSYAYGSNGMTPAFAGDASNQVTVEEDGTQKMTDANGTEYITKPDGQVSVKTSDGKTYQLSEDGQLVEEQKELSWWDKLTSIGKGIGKAAVGMVEALMKPENWPLIAGMVAFTVLTGGIGGIILLGAGVGIGAYQGISSGIKASQLEAEGKYDEAKAQYENVGGGIFGVASSILPLKLLPKGTSSFSTIKDVKTGATLKMDLGLSKNAPFLTNLKNGSVNYVQTLFGKPLQVVKSGTNGASPQILSMPQLFFHNIHGSLTKLPNNAVFQTFWPAVKRAWYSKRNNASKVNDLKTKIDSHQGLKAEIQNATDSFNKQPSLLNTINSTVPSVANNAKLQGTLNRFGLNNKTGFFSNFIPNFNRGYQNGLKWMKGDQIHSEFLSKYPKLNGLWNGSQIPKGFHYFQMGQDLVIGGMYKTGPANTLGTMNLLKGTPGTPPESNNFPYAALPPIAAASNHFIA